MMLMPNSGRRIETCSTPKEIVGFICELGQEGRKLDYFSTLSTAVYDTAWLSMVHKNEDGQISWCFPECFDYLLRSQRENGMWDTYASPLDGLLNTLAALLSLLTRRKLDPDSSTEGISLLSRVQKAQTGLQLLLQSWNVDEAVHVGFEILVPALLRQVEQFGIHFEFQGRWRLLQLHNQKMERFRPELVYSKQQTTLLHSLEALIGLVEFDSVSHHCSEEAGMFGSPASTAAYLLNCSKWDERAENYLRNTVSAVGDCGGVPSAFPTCIFEVSWTLSTLLSHVVPLKDLEAHEISILSSFLARTMEKQNGVVGFAPGVLEDADDTARVILTLQLLGNDVNPGRMMEIFEGDSCFKTYELEQNPSFSANCNVLLALLESKSVDQYIVQIEKTLNFLLLQWGSGNVVDKWNLSNQYSSMLLSGALLRLLEKWDEGDLQQLPASLIQHQLPIALCRILSKTLNEQREDGSWAGSVETTAYSVLTISRCLSLPWNAELRDSLVETLSRGRNFIISRQQDRLGGDYLWVEKVTFGSPWLRKTYCISALHAPYEQHIWGKSVMELFSLPGTGSKKMRHLFSMLPLFKQSRLISIDLAFLEAGKFSKRLKDNRDIIFPRDVMPMTEDKYLEYIPIIWTSCNQIGGYALSSDTLWSMLMLSLLNYQIDEYMESVVVHLEESDIRLLLSAISDECQLNGEAKKFHVPNNLSPLSPPKADSNSQNGYALLESTPQQSISSLENVINVLTKYIRHILHCPAVRQSPQSTQRELAVEIYNFIRAHIEHNLDNVRLKAHRELLKKNPSHYSSLGLSHSSYFKWVHSVGADDTSCPFSFQFFSCLISKPGRTCFEGSQARYLSQSLARHLAIMCRQYNDYGSAVRDTDEGNLNSLDFPEFQHGSEEEMINGNAASANGGAPHVNGNETINGSTALTNSGMSHLNGNEMINGSTALTNGGTSYLNGTELCSPASPYPPDAMKSELMKIAEFERACMQLALQNLRETVDSPATMKALQVFIDTTDVFGQVYVQKDIASRIQARTP